MPKLPDSAWVLYPTCLASVGTRRPVAHVLMCVQSRSGVGRQVAFNTALISHRLKRCVQPQLSV